MTVLVKTVINAGIWEFVDYISFGSNNTANILPWHWLNNDFEDRADEGSTGISIDTYVVTQLHRRV